jgi:hypothetical protein
MAASFLPALDRIVSRPTLDSQSRDVDGPGDPIVDLQPSAFCLQPSEREDCRKYQPGRADDRECIRRPDSRRRACAPASSVPSSGQQVARLRAEGRSGHLRFRSRRVRWRIARPSRHSPLGFEGFRPVRGRMTPGQLSNRGKEFPHACPISVGSGRLRPGDVGFCRLDGLGPGRAALRLRAFRYALDSGRCAGDHLAACERASGDIGGDAAGRRCSRDGGRSRHSAASWCGGPHPSFAHGPQALRRVSAGPCQGARRRRHPSSARISRGPGDGTRRDNRIRTGGHR